MDISNPDSTGKLRVTRFTLDGGSISCDFEGQVEGYGSVFVTHSMSIRPKINLEELLLEARTFLEDGTQLTTPHGGTFTQEQSVIRLYHTDLVSDGSINFIITEINILTKDVNARLWTARPAS